ncbi:MAG: CvpA family protein [Oscillospiraceae bacterium]|jgi:hypothetical protein|nr:CvpA family protein [Oscillospiraceae bacterium]
MDSPEKKESTETTKSTASVFIEPQKPARVFLLSLIGTLIAAAVGYYLYLPALNPKAAELWIYLAGVVVAYLIFLTIFSGSVRNPEYSPYVRKKSLVPFLLIAAILITAGIGYVAGSSFFRAKDYSQLLNLKEKAEKDFGRDIAPATAASFSRIPHLDELSAQQIANKAMSDLGDSDLVSQYTVYPMYTQINYKNQPVRVVPLQYANIIKWLTNTGRGLPGYITIDMSDETYNFHKLEADHYIRYSPAEHFNKLLKRHLRFEYPTYLLGDATFEIDEEGKPYWVVPRYDNTLGLFGGKDVIGAVLVYADSPTGESFDKTTDELKSDASFKWLDRIYNSDLLVKQFNFAGKFKEGFWNSILGQKDVIKATDGHNYLALDDDVYLYTGVTSANGDESIIGFVLINQRTKEASYYSVGGATELAAKASAEGLVRAQNYTATFPILINIEGQPTYFMALKDEKENAQLVMQYAFVSVKEYNKVRANASTVKEALRLYTAALKSNGITTGKTPAEDPGKEGVIAEIRSQIVEGNTIYYIQLVGDKTWYRLSANAYELAVLLSKGEKLALEADEAVDGVANASIK